MIISDSLGKVVVVTIKHEQNTVCSKPHLNRIYHVCAHRHLYGSVNIYTTRHPSHPVVNYHEPFFRSYVVTSALLGRFLKPFGGNI